MDKFILLFLFVMYGQATEILQNQNSNQNQNLNFNPGSLESRVRQVSQLLEAATLSSATNANSTGLMEAASGSGYYYDKSRYKSDGYGYGYQPSYGSGGEYGSYENCYGQPPGTVGNPSYNCQSFTVCQSDGRLDVMDCPAYLRFNNYLGVCDWPYKVDSYCNPLYKEEYYPSYNYGKSYERSYEKPYEKPYEKAYEKPYEKPAYYPQKYESYSPKEYRNYYKKY